MRIVQIRLRETVDGLPPVGGLQHPRGGQGDAHVLRDQRAWDGLLSAAGILDGRLLTTRQEAERGEGCDVRLCHLELEKRGRGLMLECFEFSTGSMLELRIELSQHGQHVPVTVGFEAARAKTEEALTGLSSSDLAAIGNLENRGQRTGSEIRCNRYL